MSKKTPHGRNPSLPQRRKHRAKPIDYSNLRRENKLLRQEKDSLLSTASNLLQVVQSDGKVIVTDQLESGLVVPVATAARAYQQGAEDALTIVSAMERATHVVEKHITTVKTAALCSNGPDTRTSMQAALSNFVGAVQDFEVVCRKSKNNGLIAFNWTVIDQAIHQWGNIRQSAADFLVIGSYTAQRVLRQTVASADPTFAQIDAEFANAKRRGRPSGMGDTRKRLAQRVHRIWTATAKTQAELYDDVQRELLEGIVTNGSDEALCREELDAFRARKIDPDDQRAKGKFISELISDFHEELNLVRQN